MRQLQFLVTAREPARSLDDFVTDLENCLGLGMGMGEMYRHMMQNRWMGPGDISGPGGFQPGNDQGNGPGQDGTQGGGNDNPGGDGGGPGGPGGGNGGNGR